MDIKISSEVHPIRFNSVIPYHNFTSDVQNYTDAPLAHVDCTGLTKFVTNTLISGTLCLLGLVGNSVSFVVLVMDEDSKVAAIQLQALAFTDNFFLAMWFLHFTIADALTYFKVEQAFHVNWLYIRVYTYPLLFVGQTGTIWLTVLIASSRYIAVCWPYHASKYSNVQVKSKAVVGIAVFSIIYNIPRIFEVHILPNLDIVNITDGVNTTKTVAGYRLEYTHFGSSWLYREVYFNACYMITSFILPLLLLLYLNTRLTLVYRKVQRRRTMMNSCREHHDNSITLVMIMVVLLFIICNAPARIVQLIWQYQAYQCPKPAFIMNILSNVMEVLNSSSNFIIYCICRCQFRRNLARRMCVETRQTEDINGTITNCTLLQAM